MDKVKEKIITVTSNKGGTGKTTVSLCLALYFSCKKNRKTLLLEMDSSPGDFTVLFDADDDNSIEIALKFPSKLANYAKNVGNNLDIIKGFSNPLSAEEVKTDEINNLLSTALKKYEIIIVDTQNVLNGSIVDVLKITDYVFLISDLEIESLYRNLEFINLLKSKFLLHHDNFYFLINKKRFIDIFKIMDISKVITLPIMGFISFERNFNKSLVMKNKNKFLKTRTFINMSKILEGFYLKNIV
ncbi:MAG TPA: ParA family protein [Actinobacteria bacterium]|nr:ParA family protein [Actinomycetota bacterium]